MRQEEMIRRSHDALFNALPETFSQKDKERIEEAGHHGDCAAARCWILPGRQPQVQHHLCPGLRTLLKNLF